MSSKYIFFRKIFLSVDYFYKLFFQPTVVALFVAVVALFVAVVALFVAVVALFVAVVALFVAQLSFYLV